MVLSAFDSAMGQGLYMPLDYSRIGTAPLPKTEAWQGISKGFTKYAWLNTGPVKPLDKSDVDRSTLMFSFTRSYSFHPQYERISFNLPIYVEPRTFNRYRTENRVSEFWALGLMNSIKKDQADKAKGLFNIEVPIKFPKAVQSLVGEGGVGLRVNGYYRVSFDGRSQWDDRQQVATYKQSKFPSLNMEQVSQFKITGTIGSKIEVQVDQDSKRQTDLDNRIQIRYKGTEDDIIQTIEAGNTNLSLPNTQFVGYTQRVQGLFGIKATAKLGNLGLTLITSQEKGNTEKSSFTAGSDKSTKYIRDYEYLANTFFDLGIPNVHYFAGERVVDFKLYKDETRIEESPIPGIAYVEPDRPDQNQSETYETQWVELERNKYFAYDTEFYLEMRTYISQQDYLACWMLLEDEQGNQREIGDISSDTLQLMLIKRANPLPSYVTFDYEWKNVYSMRTTNIDEDGLEVQIYKGKAGTETNEDDNLDHQNGTPYIELLGLDSLDLNGAANPDGAIDINDRNVFLDRGFIIFPKREPFADSAVLNDIVSEIYTQSNSTNIREQSKYYLAITLKQRLTEFPLGKINIIENSEVVQLNGRRLTKDQDYTIYYDLGRIIFRTDEVLDPNADVTVDFEYQPFIAAEKKSLFGTRLEYVLSQDFKFGTTLLYKAEKSTDRKPRVGQEESKYIVWDSDFSTRFELPILTDIIDAFPLIEATSTSNVNLSAEIAQSIPNPNTRGDAYIDDFEGSREAYSLSVRRDAWTKCSPPVEGTGFYSNLTVNPRGHMIWYNPWEETPITEIWNRDVRDRDNRTYTLVLRIDPDSTLGKDSWTGVMRPISRGSWDQSRTQYLEIRMKRPATDGQMRIYLGEISEDIDGDGQWDTEDKNFNDLLEDEEDVGLDGWTDEQERENLGSTEDDPSGDNWFYDNDETNRNYYEQINGTQGNAKDPGRGFLPDTEDINGSKALDRNNAYYEFVLDFGREEDYLVPNSEKNGWVTYRFPLDSPDDSLVDATWERVSFARIILTGFEERDFVELASMDLVSTRWLVQDLDTMTAEVLPELALADTGETKLEVAVVNTEEHATYDPPPDVEGYYDKVNDIREKEQSLLLKYQNFEPGIRGFAQRILYSGENYAGYRRLQMYVHSDRTDSNFYFIFRMGTDSLNFYEYRTNVFGSSTEKWDRRNWVDIDFDQITQVKDQLNELKVDNPDTNYISNGVYGVRGQPRLTNVIYFAVGVERPETASPDSSVTGELWLDELRVTDVRKDKGLAKRFSISTSVSDVGSFSYSYKKTDEYYRQLTAADRNNLGSGKEQTSIGINATFNFDKLLPPQWGARIPISYGWSKSESVPRLKSGSDIVILEEDRESETTRSYSERFSISEKINRNTKNWLWDLTLNNFDSKFSYTKSRSKSPTQPKSESENYTANANYNLVTTKKTFRIFGWTSIIPLFPKAISNSEVGYFPNRLTFKGTVDRRKSFSINNQGNTFSTYDRKFNGSMAIAYNLFASLPLSFNLTTSRDLRDPETIKFSLNPKEFKLGIELSRRQSFTLKYDPKIFKFLSTGFSFKSSYDENADPKRYADGTRLASTSSNWSLSGRFDSQKFFGKGGSKSNDFVLLKPFLLIIRPFSNRIDPISLNYSQDNRYSSSGLVDRPSVKFQFGLTKDPGVDIIEASGIGATRRFNDTRAETYSAKSGFRFLLGSKVQAGYSQRFQTSSTQRNETKSVSFPDLSLSIGRLERYRILGWLFNSVTLNTAYSKKTDETISKSTGEKEKENVTNNFGPLIGFSVTWFKSVKTQGRIELSTSSNKTITGGVTREQKNTTKGFTISTSYSFRSPTGLKIPLFGRIKFQSTMSLSVDISKRLNKSEQVDAAGNMSLTSERSDLTIAPRASYSFSSNIQGGLQMRWSDTEDKRTRRKSHVRQVGIWVEIRF